MTGLRCRVAALLLVLLAGAGQAARADSLRFCDAPREPDAAQLDRIMRFAALVKGELERSGQDLALIARSGLHLERFGQRYSHAGLSLRASANTPWSVRQLYYACDEGRPRLFDQGISGFLLGSSEPDEGYVALILLPDAPDAAADSAAGAALAAAALDDRRALSLLGAAYSANAYPFSTRYQNCNQWLAELMALAWGGRAADDAADPRAQAQQWLRRAGYRPTTMQAGAWMLAGLFVPWVHDRDHPQADLAAGRYRVSMPASLADFVRQQVPGARRIELCHGGTRAVIHQGWDDIAAGCLPGPGDRQIALD
ncbi:MAG: DUF2145 domain-containing protein [Burkholderiaceae bacterium]